MLLKLIGLIIPLGLDTFAVSAALGMNTIPAKKRLMISLFFTGFEAGMPIIGLLAGEPLHRFIGDKADLVAFSILIIFGAYTLLHKKEDEGAQAKAMMNKWGLSALILGITISIDEIAIGLTLGVLGFPIVPVLTVIAAQAFVFSQLGFWLGGKLSERFRESAETLAGIALIGIGILLLWQHLA